MVVHMRLPDGWKKPTLCGRDGKQSAKVYGDGVTCKLCLRIEESVSHPDEPRGFAE